MKKVLLFVLVMIVSVFMLASCKSKKKDTEETKIPLFDYMGSDLTEYIDLKGYKDLKMPREQYMLGYYYTLYSEFSAHDHEEDKMEITYSEPITDRTIMYGDLVDLDYEGIIDGKPFTGGTSKGFKLFIGSNAFIDGFESSLVGRGLEGDREFSIYLKFPTNYIHSDLAGKDVEFKVKINSYVEINYPEITDDIAVHLGYKNAEAYEKSISENIKNSHAIKVITNASTFHKLPNGQVDRYISDTMEQFAYYAAMFGMTIEQYTEAYFGYTAEQLYELIKREAEGYIKGRLIFCSIAKLEGITATEEEYNAQVDEYIQTNPRLTKEDVEKMYGEKYIKENIINEKAYTWLSEHVTLTD